jgi:hypothetical protein
MFRIFTNESRTRVVITMDGQLVGEYVQVAETVCKQAALSGKRIQIVLRNVNTVDENGRNLLRHLQDDGHSLLAHGVYNNYIVESLGR